LALMAEAGAVRKIILASPEQYIVSIAASDGRCRTRLGKLAALACLAPDIVTAIAEVRHRRCSADSPVEASRSLSSYLPKPRALAGRGSA
jgi:hypothetical protein